MSEQDDQEHCSDVFQLDEGEQVTLIMDDGAEVDVTVDHKSRHHDESGPNISEQLTVGFTRESDGVGLRLSRVYGVSGLPDGDPFPSFFPLFESELVEPGREIPDDHILGYVDDIRRCVQDGREDAEKISTDLPEQRDEPTGEDSDRTIDVAHPTGETNKADIDHDN